MSKLRLQYWDSDVIIHRIQRTPKHIGVLEQLTEEAENGRLGIVISTYSIAEIVKDPDGQSISAAEDEKIQRLFENPYFIVRPLTLPISHLARQISRQYGIKPKDSVHIATAAYWKVPEFLTYDGQLLKNNGKIGEPQRPLVIQEPQWIGQMNLLESESSPVSVGVSD